MKKTMRNMFESTKKKAVVATACGAMVIGIGSGAAFASSDSAKLKMDKGQTSVQDEIKSEKVKMLVKNENGKISHSTDDGKTWTEGAPKDSKIIQDKDSNEIVIKGKVAGTKDSILTKKENGKMKYSTDNGKTWSERAPKGSFDRTVAHGNLIVKNNDGKVTHSTDGGKTWRKGAPEGVGEGNFLFKKENGKLKISSDGGKTWVDRTPKEVYKTKNPENPANIKSDKIDSKL